MFLQPITSLAPLMPMKPTGGAEETGNQLPFKSFFTDAINNVKETDQILQNEIQNAVVGNTDDLHSVNIASTKAGLAIDMVIQLRNKALDSYNEIMRMGV